MTMQNVVNAPTRRNLLGHAAGIASAIGIVRHASAAPPDQDLVAACNDYLRIQRKWSAYCASLGDKDIEADDPSLAILEPLPSLVERIVALRATTADGHAARAQCMTFAFLPTAMICRDNPDGAAEDRFESAMYRDLVRAEMGSVA